MLIERLSPEEIPEVTLWLVVLLKQTLRVSVRVFSNSLILV
jgi:hypothetical protein